ncbi:MAG: SusF/SusE family outer membrane protein, partial [Bacilli bacterium]|nr:SusF/SusE family outer membrane protein [Bacilli bacterium]
MKKKGVFFALGISASLIAGFAISANNSILPAKATKGAGDETWYLLGTRNNWAQNEYPLVYTEANGQAYYLLEIELEANEEFKICNGTDWVGYGGNTGGGIGTYLSQADGGNFKVNEAGKYIITIKDDNVAAYGDKSYGFSISEAEWYLSYYNGVDEVLDKRITMAKNEHNPYEFSANMAAFAQSDEWKIHSKLGKVRINSYSFSHEGKMTFISDKNVVVNEAGNYTVTMNYLNNTSY